MKDKERISEVIELLMKDKQEPTLSNIMFKSLFTSGGTLTDEDEINSFIANNVFYFIDGIMYINEVSETITVNSKTLKVVSDYEYTFKFLKTKVKAINGINGLMEFVKENRKLGSLFFFPLNNVCKQLN